MVSLLTRPVRVGHVIIAFINCMPIQVIPGYGNPQKSRTMFGGYLFKYCCVKYQTFHQVGEKASHAVKRLTPKNYLKSFSDASESHKTSANLSVQAYFRQFSDW